MDKHIAGSILVIAATLGGIVVAGVHGIQNHASKDMHSTSVVDEHGARSVSTWRG